MPRENENEVVEATNNVPSANSGHNPAAPQPQQPQQEPASVRDILEEYDLKYGAHHVIMLFTPVTLCMMVVVITIRSVNYYTEFDGHYLVYTPFHETSSDAVTIAWNAMANAAILLCVIAFMTVLLILAYKFKCYKLIHGWLFMSSLILLFIFSFLYLGEVLKAYNLPMDYFTLALFMWNFGIVGMLCIHWKGPLLLQQAYLIFISALMALFFIKFLPNWTTWAVLAVVSLWDLFAVLAPFGPLKILVETAQERNESIFPSLIYSSGIIYEIVGATDSPSTADNQLQNVEEQQNIVEQPLNMGGGDDTSGFSQRWVQQRNAHLRANPQDASVAVPLRGATDSGPVNVNRQSQAASDEGGIKLGLGDFIFYSILVGKASTIGDWNTTLACFVAILIGLCLTLIFLATMRRALPALPFSIAFGLIFCLLTNQIISPFCDAMTSNQIFI